MIWWEGHEICPNCEDTINITIRHIDQMLYLSCGYCGHQDSCCEPYMEVEANELYEVRKIG